MTDRRLDVPDEVRHGMSSILDPGGLERWWHTSVPALGYRTPRDAWDEDSDEVRALIHSYHTGEFS